MTDVILEAMKKWKEGPQPPVVLDINPTDYCNLKCKSCWQRNWKYRKLDSKHYQVEDARLLEVIQEAADMGIKKVMITGGGEPLMRPVTKEIMRQIKKLGMEGELTTNGTLLSEEFIEELVEIGWDKIVFSIDGGTEEVNDHLRGKGSFQKSYRNLKLLKQYKGLKEKPIVTLNTVVSRANYDKLDEIVLLAHEVGAESVMFEPLTVHSWRGRLMKAGKSHEKKITMLIPSIKRLGDELGVHTNIESLSRNEFIEKSNRMDKVIEKNRDKSDFSAACFEPWYHLVVKVDGAVGPCCIFDEKTLNAKTMSLREIWHGEWFNNLRKQMKEGKLPSWCRICNAGQVTQNESIRKELGKI